jgi:MoaA/NifB/PqqE/SkfB family radical SAM enzyme
MIQQAKKTGRPVELITNGTLLDEDMSGKIVDSVLDKLWVSLDSMEEESGVISNIKLFNKKRGFVHFYLDIHGSLRTKLGIAIVLMKNNLPEFKKLLKAAYLFGISDIKASHLIPYNESQLDQICYERVLGSGLYDTPENLNTRVNMPLLDTRDIQEQNMLQLFSHPSLSFSFMGPPLEVKTDYCRFVADGVTFVRWDGEVSPCMALLHENKIYQRNTERYIRPCSFGNINSQKLSEVWENNSYDSFRERVKRFDFSPCTQCGPCEMFKTNEEDCLCNTFPTCGACLWARGLFQCP